jgi:RNA polymerase primary sigma factor
MRLYLKEISKIKPITPKEEKQLAKRIQKGDEEALRRLVEANLRFVIKIAKKYRGCGLPFTDLINEGNMGLIEAAKRFDPKRNVKFTSYAVWWIRQAILHAVSDMGHSMRLPPKISNMIYKIGTTLVKQSHQLKRKPTMEELAKTLDIPQKELENIMEISANSVSINQPIDDEGELELEDTLQQQSMPSVEESLFRSFMENTLSECLTILDQREKQVIDLRFGLNDQKPKTLKEIGELMGLSRERIRQIEAKALEKLRNYKKCQGLQSYLN